MWWGSASPHTFSLSSWNTHLWSQTIKGKLVCRRKHQCFKVTSNWVQRNKSEKDLTEYNMPNSHKKREKGSYLAGSTKRGKHFTGTAVQRQVAKREQAKYRWRQHEPENEKGPEDQNRLIRLIWDQAEQLKRGREREKPNWTSLERSLSWTERASQSSDQEQVNLLNSKSHRLKTF